MYNIYAFFIRFSCVIGKMIVKKVFINVSLFFLFFLCSLSVYVIIYIFERYKSRCLCTGKNASILICFQAYGYGTRYIISTFCFQFFLRVAKLPTVKKPSPQVQTKKETGSIL